MLGICAGLMGPKTENVEKVLVLKLFLKGQDGHDYAKTANNSPSRRVSGPFWGHFGVTLGSFWGLWGYFWYMKVTSESFWPVFTKYLFFLYILMIL